jgi:hypothetical protein
VAFSAELSESCIILRERSILTHDKEGDSNASLAKEREGAWNHNVQVGGKTLPPWISVGFHIRPLVVQVQRETRRPLRFVILSRHNSSGR